MADLLRIFKDIGEVYAKEALAVYNEFEKKNISKIALYDIATGELTLADPESWKDRLFLRVTSSNGGNLYPFFYYDDKKFAASMKKALKNMRRYADDPQKIDELEKRIDIQRINELVKPYKEKNLYFALLENGRTMNEIFPDVAKNYAESVCEGDVTVEGESFFDTTATIGYDPGLNFCSVNELPKALQKVKYRLLPLAKDEACLVKLGFLKVFEEDAFRFRLFGLSYYLLPTIFAKDKRPFFDLISQVKDQEILERRLRLLVKRLEGTPLFERVLLSFLFAKKSNAAIDLLHLIEDVAPSRISRGFELMDEMRIDERARRYVKKSERDDDYLYIRDYIDDGLLLAKLLFGKECITKEALIEAVAKKIRYDEVKNDGSRRPMGDVVAFEDIKDFEKHQRLLDFFARLDVICGQKRTADYLYKETTMDGRFSDVAKRKFEEVELLRELPRARELYALGALARYVMDWQYAQGADSFRKYLDSMGAVGMHNADKIFRKAYDISRKYGIYGETYEDLLDLYAHIKEQLGAKDRIGMDEATIAFVMGAVDFKEYKNQKESDDDGKAE